MSGACEASIMIPTAFKGKWGGLFVPVEHLLCIHPARLSTPPEVHLNGKPNPNTGYFR